MFWSKKTIWNSRTMLTNVCVLLLMSTGNAKADFVFGEPVNLGPVVNTSAGETHPNVSADGLSLFFRSDRPDGCGDVDLWVTTRATIEDEWSTPVNLGSTVNSSSKDSSPSISVDGLSLYFASDRPGGYGGEDIWVSTRPTLSDPWGEPVNLGPIVNGPYRDSGPSISYDGLELYFCDIGSGPFRPGDLGGGDLWVTTRAATEGEWSIPVNLGPTVNSPAWDANPSISAGGRALFFLSCRPDTDLDIWLSRRTVTDDLWSTPVNLGPPVNTSNNDGFPSISVDGCTLYFGSNRSGGSGRGDLWQVSIIPIVDFNGDGILDVADIDILIDRWGTDDSLCDIGPIPWGDGIVDVQDLIILAEHMVEARNDAPDVDDTE